MTDAQVKIPPDAYVPGNRGGSASKRCGRILWRGQWSDLNTVAFNKGVSRALVRYCLEEWVPTISIDDLMRLSWPELRKLYQDRRDAVRNGTAQTCTNTYNVDDLFKQFSRRKLV